MKAEPRSVARSTLLSERVNAAYEFLWETHPRKFRSWSELLFWALEEFARRKVPHMFIAAGDEDSGEGPVRGSEPKGRPPRRVLRYGAIAGASWLPRWLRPRLPERPAAMPSAGWRAPQWRALTALRGRRADMGVGPSLSSFRLPALRGAFCCREYSR